MKRISKVIPWILAFALLIFCFAAVLPSQANADSDPSRYPTVFVHGLYGFGSYDKLNDILPYWGSHTGSVIKELTGEGHPSYAASVGPFSSTWDRACELYAQITGTRTDYGIAHSQRCGHERYGRDFTGKGLIPNLNWDSAHPINLIGHSFGGVTIRMFVDLLYDGCAEEVEASRAAGETVSPLFTGGHNGWIHSVTTVSSPHNGSTFIDANPLSTIVGPRFFFYAFHGVNTALPGMLDPMLDQFGLYKGDNESAVSMVSRILSSDFYSHDDNAVNDMRIPHAMALNAQMELRSDIYYFSIYGNTTITTATFDSPEIGTGKTITLHYDLVQNSYAANYLPPDEEVYTTDGKIIAPTVLDSAFGTNGIEVAADGYCPSEDDYATMTCHVANGSPSYYVIRYPEESAGWGPEEIRDTLILNGANTFDITFPIPEDFPEGRHTATITIGNEAGDEIVTTRDFFVNLSNKYLVLAFNDVVSIDNNNERFKTFQWYKNGEPIEGATLPYYQFSDAGSYSVRVNAGTEDEHMICPININTSEFKSMTVAPNPVMNNTKVKIVGSDRELHVLVLYNSYGTAVLKTTFTGSEYILNMSNLPQGIYMLSVDDMNAKTVKL